MLMVIKNDQYNESIDLIDMVYSFTNKTLFSKIFKWVRHLNGEFSAEVSHFKDIIIFPSCSKIKEF